MTIVIRYGYASLFIIVHFKVIFVVGKQQELSMKFCQILCEQTPYILASAKVSKFSLVTLTPSVFLRSLFIMPF